MPKQADIPLAHDLALYTTNTCALYSARALPILRNLAAKHAAGTYDAALALKLWRYLADDGAKAYATEFRMSSVANVPTRELAAVEIAAHYADQLAELAEEYKADKANKARWTLSEVRHANEEAGLYFFSPDTMRFFGDTMKSFALDFQGGKIFVVRVKAPAKAPESIGRAKIGERREFDPQTGSIGPVIGE